MMASVLCSSETILPVQPCIGTGRDGKMIEDRDGLSDSSAAQNFIVSKSRKWALQCSVLRTGV